MEWLMWRNLLEIEYYTCNPLILTEPNTNKRLIMYLLVSAEALGAVLKSMTMS